MTTVTNVRIRPPITDERPPLPREEGSRCFGPSILAAIGVRQDYVNF